MPKDQKCLVPGPEALCAAFVQKYQVRQVKLDYLKNFWNKVSLQLWLQWNCTGITDPRISVPYSGRLQKLPLHTSACNAARWLAVLHMSQDVAEDGVQIQCPYYSLRWASYPVTSAYLDAGVCRSSQLQVKKLLYWSWTFSQDQDLSGTSNINKI